MFYHTKFQALPQFPFLQNRPGDSFRKDPRIPGTRWEARLGDCNPLYPSSTPGSLAPTANAPAHPSPWPPAQSVGSGLPWPGRPWHHRPGRTAGAPDTHRRPGRSRGLGLGRKGGGACVGQPRPQVGTTDQSALAAARSDPIPEAQLCPIKRSGWYALPIRSWRSVPGVGKEPGRECAAVGGARA